MDEMDVQKVAETPRETAHARIYRVLKEALISGQYRPGQAISIRFLAEQFNVSATPVREVLKRLESDHALVKGSNRALMVPQLSIGELKDLCSIRIATEGLATEMAVHRITERELDKVSWLCQEMDTALQEADTNGYLRLNWEFHRTVYASAKTELALGIIESLWLRAGPYLRLPVLAASQTGKHVNRSHSMQCHYTCVDGLRRGDVKRARQAIEDDIRGASKELLNHLLPQTESGVDRMVPQLHEPLVYHLSPK
ncbi:MAG: GntR family transcriptional regulator [Motiliproteus sp.]